MHAQASDPLRTVTTLMLVRHMPETDFATLCANLLDAQGITVDDQTVLDVAGPSETFSDLPGRLEAALDHAGPPGTSCDVCGDPVGEVTPITEAAQRATGMRACKLCIDTALGAIFTPRDENGQPVPGLSTPRHVIHLAAAIRGGKPRPRLGRRHAA